MLKHDDRLDGVKPPLARVIRLAVSRLSFDTCLAEGVRSREQMAINWGKGRTAAECRAKGVDPKHAQPKLPRVTWLANPFASNHAADPTDGKGKAVDLYPLVKGALANTRDHLPLFRALYEAVMAAGRELGARVRYGGDWDADGTLFEKGENDAVHFELVG